MLVAVVVEVARRYPEVVAEAVVFLAIIAWERRRRRQRRRQRWR